MNQTNPLNIKRPNALLYLATLAALTSIVAVPAWSTMAENAPAAAPRSGRSIVVLDQVIGRTPTSVAVGLEDVNHEIYGGIYSQMIFGEAFAEPERSPGISAHWRASGGGPGTSYSLVATAPFKGKQSQRIERVGGDTWAGIENRGLNRQGLSIVAGKSYEGKIVLRSNQPISVRLSFQSADGKTIYGQQVLQVTSGEWKTLDFGLMPSQNDRHARFAIETRMAGTVDVGYVLVQPGAWGRYKNLPVRADVAAAMERQGLQAIRFGGCANGGCGDVSDYKWKSMIGDPVQRPVTRGFWYPQESNGFGIFEFLQLGEALGIEAVPSLNIDESAADIRDLMDYLYGSANTRWGAQRIADGHPQPYKVRRIQLGNEEAVDDAYYAKFEALAETIWAYDRDIRLVVGDFTFEDVIEDPFSFTGARKIKSLAAHQKLLQLAAKWNAEIDFDVHLWTRNIQDPGRIRKEGNLHGQILALDSYASSLRALAPGGARFKVVVFELNATSHDLDRALANAYAITALQRRPYIDLISSANGLQVDGQNDNGWDQGLIFMDQGKVWVQPPYHVHRMIAGSQRANVLKIDINGHDEQVEATAFQDAAGISLHLVNAAKDAIAYDIDFGRRAAGVDVDVTMIGNDRGTALNTASNPENIAPGTSTFKLDGDGRATYELPQRSFTTMQITWRNR